MPELSKKLMTKTGEKITMHMENYQKAIDTAFNQEDVERLAVTCKAVFSVTSKGLKVVTSIKFRPNLDVEDGSAFYYDEKQMELFPDNS